MEKLIDEDDCLVIVYRDWINSDWCKNVNIDEKLYYGIVVEKCVNRRSKMVNGVLTVKPRLTYGCGSEVVVGTEYPNSGYLMEPWIPELELLNDQISIFLFEKLGFKIFTDSCVINGYINPEDYIFPHMDKEALGINKPVITLSLGSSRKFKFKWTNKKQQLTTTLHNGDLLLIYGDTNRKITHEILKEHNPTQPRYSLSFRTISNITLSSTSSIHQDIKYTSPLTI